MDGEQPLPGQYYMTRGAVRSVPDGFSAYDFEGWTVALDANHSVREVVRPDGENVGVLFGTVLDMSDHTAHGSIELTRTREREQESVGDSFEDLLKDLMGRYVGLVRAGTELRLYVDPAGSLPAVYDPEARIVASAPGAMPGVNHTDRFRSDLYNSVRWPLLTEGANVWLPGRITYHEGVRRLLPNHYLDLGSFEPNRYWPARGQLQINPNTSSEINAIVTELQDAFTTLTRIYDSPTLSLTAGKDSRSLLAASSEFAKTGELSCFTFDRGTEDADVRTARRIAIENGVRWEPLPTVQATRQDLDRWNEATGYSVGSAIAHIHPTLRNLDADVQIGGLGGEVGRGYLWRESDRSEMDFDIEEFLFRLHKPSLPELAEAIEAWYGEVAHFDAYTILDLAYQELRLGCWGGPQHLGLPVELDYVRPLWNRRVLESMYRLQPDVRRHDELPLRIVNETWPGLGNYPYNRQTGWRGHLQPLQRGTKLAFTAAENPRFAISYLFRKLRRAANR